MNRNYVPIFLPSKFIGYAASDNKPIFFVPLKSRAWASFVTTSPFEDFLLVLSAKSFKISWTAKQLENKYLYF